MNNHQRFFAQLSGSEEVPPVCTNAFGLAKFKVSSNERRMGFRLTVNKLNNFTQGHIHLGRRGENGPVVAFLFGPVDPDISVNKGVVEGIITANDLVGPLEGEPLSKLIDLMRDGKTYVNAHTAQYPDGEIRGQIKSLRHDRCSEY
ncbi:CHRD domain-containing protein [Cytobacillus horneckiae]|uniref:CHRD domain-containing protein n=1 Tax=Cytobacillus horneckiae TaxID=549687 RepID=UPI003D257668